MLKNLIESKLSTKFLIIGDTENTSGHDLFTAALKSHIADVSITKINLICYENPIAAYLPNSSTNEKVIAYNYFTDPCGWSDPSAPKSDLSSFISHPVDSSPPTTLFIDSLTHFVNYHGYCTLYKTLSALKQVAHKIVGLAHCDLFTPKQVEELHFLASAFLTLKQDPEKRIGEERTVQVVYKKPGGKVIKQWEVFTLVDDLKMWYRINKTKAAVKSDKKDDIQELATFRLGLQMSEEERKAKEELVLPYLKSPVSKITYEPEPDELEEDPDDDLDI